MSIDMEEFNRRFSFPIEKNDQFIETDFDSYFIPNTKTLKNKYNILDKYRLDEIEDLITSKRLLLLYMYRDFYNKNGYIDFTNSELSYEDRKLVYNILNGGLDKNNFFRLHEFIFGPLYYFAGKQREVEMSKIYYTSEKGKTVEKYTSYVKPRYIDNELSELFDDYLNRKVVNNKTSIARYLSEFYYNIFRIHPFREGNKRTAREFIRELVLIKFPNYEIDLTRLCRIGKPMNPNDEFEGNEFLRELITSLLMGFPSYNFSLVFENALIEIEKEKVLTK